MDGSLQKLLENNNSNQIIDVNKFKLRDVLNLYYQSIETLSFLEINNIANVYICPKKIFYKINRFG